MYRGRAVFEIARSLKAFFYLDMGLTRGAVPELDRKPERPERDRSRVDQMRERPSIEDNLSARKYVLRNHGYKNRLPVIDLLDLLPGLDETVAPYTFLEGQALPTDIALLKGLAKDLPGCKYLEIGSWRGESIANVAAVAEECVSLSLSEHELRELGFGEDFILQHDLFSKDLENVRHIKHNSHTYDFSEIESYFDLVFIDGDQSYEGVKTGTHNAFDVLKDDQSVIVWHDYGFTPERVNWQVLAGILDGCPEDKWGELYQISNTLCAVYISKNKDLPIRYARGYEIPSKVVKSFQTPNKTFKVKLRAEKQLLSTNKERLVILDDTFPHLLSAFRIAEYNAYLKTWPNAVVRSNTVSFRALREERSFEQILDEYALQYPSFRDRVFQLDGDKTLGRELAEGDLVYTMFLHNASRFLDLIHGYDVPFVFTLYPGGGFQLNQEDSDKRLRGVLSSPNLKKVIVTQKITRDYVLDKKLCDPGKVEFVYGGVFPSDRLLGQSPAKRCYGRDKGTFDVCFVAHKYMEKGIDKGYDVFVEVARTLSKACKDVFFHVVGPYDESDIDVTEIGDKIRFYGVRPTGFFPEFYSGMDIILSPNVPFVLFPGAFDGFPTGGCIEAGLCGVAVFCTDPLDQNVAFEDGEEIVVIPRDADSISEVVAYYHERPDALYELAARGQKAFAKVFDVEAQLEPRLRLLSELLDAR